MSTGYRDVDAEIFSSSNPPLPEGVSTSFPSTPNGYSDEMEIIRRRSAAVAAHYRSPVHRQPPEQIDPKRDRLEGTSELLGAVLNSYEDRIGESDRQRYARRLSVLLDPESWDPSFSMPEPRSFVLMLNFLSAHPEFRAPSLFLTATGFFDASWRASRGQLTSLVFMPNGRISWLVFAPGTEDPDITDETAGTVRQQAVLEELDHHRALEWMLGE